MLEYFIIHLLFILKKWLWLVINRTTDYIDTITLSWHYKITWVSFKCIPYTSVVMLILWNYIRICKCLELCLLVSRIVPSSSHMSTSEIKVFISTRLNKIIISWLKLRLNWWLIKESCSSWCITMCDLLCNMLKNSKWTFMKL